MAKNKNVGEIAKVGIILFAITAIAAAILSFVNNMTYPTIEKNTIASQNEAMKKVFPLADSFVKSEDALDEILKDSSVNSIYNAEDKGFVVLANPNGYGGEVSLAVGIDEELKVTGVYVISQSETAGLGANCVNPEWQAQFIGKTENIEVVKHGANENQIDAISSATITSKAVTKGVNDALKVIKQVGGIK